MHGLNAVFDGRPSREADHEADEAELHATIGASPRALRTRARRRTRVENDFLSRGMRA